MFKVLETVDHNLQMFSTGNYSSELIISFQKEIEKLKPNISKDVFELMKKTTPRCFKYLVPLVKNDFPKIIFNTIVKNKKSYLFINRRKILIKIKINK